MKSSIEFFDEAAGVGSRIIQNLGNSPATPEVKKYLDLVARVYQVLVQIHDDVVEATIYASLAATIEEAKQALQGIQQSVLKDTLKAQDLCAKLRKLGHDLHPLTQAAKLSADDQSIWKEFCQNLEQGESQTARLYDEKLYDLHVLPGNEPSLNALKKKVEDISAQLVTQKARFDFLARMAAAMHNRL